MPVLRTRIVIDAPESLPLKRHTQLLPKAHGAGGSRQRPRTLDAANTGCSTKCARWTRTCRRTRRPGRASSSRRPTSWEAVAATYRDMTEARIRNDDARPADRGARKSPAAEHPTREYIAKVVERLHREVRYTGVEFGDARLIPEYPAETLRRRFGDCKDKSTLLVAALRASGIDAYLALLSAGDDQDVSPDLPGLGMFDHAIVYSCRRRRRGPVDRRHRRIRARRHAAGRRRRPARADHPRGREGADAHARAALGRQPPGRDARVLPGRVRPGARDRDHRDARHHRRRIPQLVRGRRHQGAPRRPDELRARTPIAPSRW